MISERPSRRFERKFVLPHATPSGVFAMIRRHPGAFREVFPERTVNNVYLDTFNHRAYRDHVHGVSRRTKVRIRWYGSFSGESESRVLEFKNKEGLLGSKAAFPIRNLAINGGVSRAAIHRCLEGAGMPENLHHKVRTLIPTLANTYRRRYFESADGRFRLTVDFELRFAGQPGSSFQWLRSHRDIPAAILELKYDEAHADAASAVAGSFPCRVTRCSKYVLGIGALSW